MTNEQWSDEEHELLVKFFNTNMTEFSLYEKIHAINPERTLKAIIRKTQHMARKGFRKKKTDAVRKLRVGYLDIEASNLNGDFGYILTWYIKEQGKNVYQFDSITKSDIDTFVFDKRVVASLLEALSNYDIVYTHYGSDYRFDIPFIRTRAYAHDLEAKIPVGLELIVRDTYPIVKQKLKLHSNRLDSVAAALGIRGVKKTSLDSGKWMKAAHGDKDALKYVLIHNLRDVQLLERVHKKLAYIEKPSMRGA